MNTQVMNHDVHSPIFIRAKTTNDKPKVEPMKRSRSIDWRRIIELVLLLSVVTGAIYFISKLVTPQVITVISIFIGFLVLRFIVRTILRVTLTLLSIFFWLAVLAAILLFVF
ncbi:hypothetical protein [Porphyromonas gingivalis]|uniref:hypothetical protein n=1 Tax=Porphyromonas gingivalis TaxID=837 RepID=UPI0024DFCC43|nr:hypothetical protein [Porphyromonas gingivalis]WIM92365.1 hypothetical protein QP877_05020 [Porphyromonas gingivalis]